MKNQHVLEHFRIYLEKNFPQLKAFTGIGTQLNGHMKQTLSALRNSYIISSKKNKIKTYPKKEICKLSCSGVCTN